MTQALCIQMESHYAACEESVGLLCVFGEVVRFKVCLPRNQPKNGRIRSVGRETASEDRVIVRYSFGDRRAIFASIRSISLSISALLRTSFTRSCWSFQI